MFSFAPFLSKRVPFPVATALCFLLSFWHNLYVLDAGYEESRDKR